MRSVLAVLVVCLVVSVSAKAQDLSEFDKKAPFSEVKTELYRQDVGLGEKEEHVGFEATTFYGIDGELTSENYKRGDFSISTEYTHKFDESGRVVQRTKKETEIFGENPPQVRPTRVWEYAYDDTGAATVTCKETEKKDGDSDPNSPKELITSETWQLDSAGRVLRYSKTFDGDEAYRVVFERDKDGRLLTKETLCGELRYNKESFTYREDGTLKESDEVVSFPMDHIKKQYGEKQFGESDLEKSGQVVDKDGKITRQWTVQRSACGKMAGGGVQDTTTYKIYGEDKEKMVLQMRYVITTTRHK